MRIWGASTAEAYPSTAPISGRAARIASEPVLLVQRPDQRAERASLEEGAARPATPLAARSPSAAGTARPRRMRSGPPAPVTRSCPASRTGASLISERGRALVCDKHLDAAG